MYVKCIFFTLSTNVLADSSSTKKLKNYRRLPLYIVEDHNEVLPYIHRAIGSHHLPFSDVTFVHFDSHPDLLIPKEMPADDVFDKELLYESISIENWIMPLVYAGHVSVIVWIKPPWCTQIADKNIFFYVGKCTTTGTIRCSCKESYFVSETLYRPESQLLNKKRVQLIVFTLKPNGWKEKPHFDKSVENIKQEGKYKSEGIKPESKENKCHSNSKLGSEECLNKQHDQEFLHRDVEEVASEKIDGHGNSDHIECDDRLNDCEDPNSNNFRALSDRKTDNTVANNEQELNDEVKSHIAQSEFRDSEGASNSVLHCGGSSSRELTVDKFRESLTSISELLQEFPDSPLILDIDLDFYSTKNPFLEVYTPSQYKILKELYSFQTPLSTSDEVCVEVLNDCEDPNSNNFRALSDRKTDSTVANNEQELNDEVKSHIAQSEFRDSEGASNSVLHCGGSSSRELTVDKFRESLTSISELLQEFPDSPLILDIDLDFYSTKNPFLEVYTPSQYKILKELYSFQTPLSTSDENVEECVLKREKELNHLKQEFLKFTECSEPKLNHSKSEKIKALVDDLQSCQADDNPVNFDLLHEAGCTCDDTELPHHVSSQEEITLLVDATQDFLCHIKRPTIITMARSSQDDYCPPEQVESIQNSVLEVLQDLYLEIELTADY
ncbi:UPF0489 protein C5orf22 homolog [Saccostrea echinata]|uniref:UPF0489 protein C5orf22 homolog n=1 Tax=Saccostrea echinata TaxID=191078 RepID=UPI002A7F854A|nr:UPF0489 protein C5orf22 homolog [Saccostrea echinata]